jgi:hypothetical protein
MSYLRFSSIAFFCFLCVSLCLGQQPAAQMTNADVTELVGMGLSNEVVVAKINTAEATAFDTSIAGLKALKAAKVSDTVIGAMINSHPAVSAQSVPGAPNEVKNSDSNDPASPHDPGIYMYTKGRGGAQQFVLLEPTVYSQGKTGGFLASAMTYGIAKTKMKAVVGGAHASVRSSDSAVVFYFYFEESQGGEHPKTFGGSITPNEYTLLKFDEKKNSRETVTMEMNAMGSSSGTDENANTGFTYTKVKDGVYKVVSSAQLAPGEYCFLKSTGQAGTAAANRLYAFGIGSSE